MLSTPVQLFRMREGFAFLDSLVQRESWTFAEVRHAKDGG